MSTGPTLIETLTAEFFDNDIRIAVNTNLPGNTHSLRSDLARRKLGVGYERSRRSQGIRAARPDRQHAVIGRNHVAITRKQKRAFLISHYQERFQMPKDFVGAPFLTQFDCGPFEIAMILFELAFESGQQRESISGCTREPGQNFVVVETAHFLRARLHNGLAYRYLAIAGHRHTTFATHKQNGRAADSGIMVLTHLAKEHYRNCRER